MPGKTGRNSAWAIAFTLLLASAGGACWVQNRQEPITLTIALIPQTAGAMVWDMEHAGATEAAEHFRYRLHWNAPTSENDVAGQVSLIDKVSRGKYAGLVLAPNHPFAILTPVRRVLQEDVPVVVVGAELDLPAIAKLAYIANDEEKMGELAAAEMAALLNGKGEIVLAGVGRNAPGVIRRARGAEEFLAGHFPGIEVVSRYGWAYNSSRAEELTTAALTAHPALKGILGFTAVATRGVQAAIASHPSAHIAVVGCEQDADLIAALRTGHVNGIVAEDSYVFGRKAIEVLAALRNGTAVAPRTIVSPVLITRANVDLPETQRLIGLGR